MELAAHLDDPLLPARNAKLLLDWMGEHGLEPDALLEGTGVDASALTLPGTRITCRQQMRLLENVLCARAGGASPSTPSAFSAMP